MVVPTAWRPFQHQQFSNFHSWKDYCVFYSHEESQDFFIFVKCDCLSEFMQFCLYEALEVFRVKRVTKWIKCFRYLEFQYRQLKSSPEKEAETKKFSELVHRCLLTMPSKFEVNHWPNVYWNNFVYINRIIDWYLKVLLPEQKSLALDRLVTRMPTNIPLVFRWVYIGLGARKPVFGALRTTKAQTSLRIRTVWSAPLLFAF